MLMTPDPVLTSLHWGERRKEDGGKRGRRKAWEYERDQAKKTQQPPSLALPNRYDAMHAPVYEAPAASVPMRPGAEDFLRIASRGVRC